MKKAPFEKISIIIPSDARYLKVIRSLLESFGSLLRFQRKEIEDVILAANEACANIINHAYNNEPHHLIYVTVTADTHQLQIELRDNGKEVEPEKIRPRPLEDIRPGGLGVHIIRELMDQVIYQQNKPHGNKLILIKKR